MDLGPTRAAREGGWWGYGWIEGLPISGSISSPFGPREPFDTPTGRTSDFHTGIDIPAPAGTPVLMPAPGRVVFQYTDNTGPYGNMVYVRFADGSGAAFLHLRKYTPMAAVGWDLRRGDIVGFVGTTGLSTGDHLHFSYLPIMPDIPITNPPTVPWFPRESFANPMLYFAENPLNAPPTVYTGFVPKGGSAYVVLTRDATPDEIVAQALYLGTPLSAIGIFGGQWLMYIPDAPAPVNADFPDLIAGGTPLFVRARA